MKRKSIVFLTLILTLFVGCSTTSNDPKKEAVSKEDETTNKTDGNADLDTKLINNNGQLRDEVIPFAEHVEGNYNIVVNLKTPEKLGITSYTYIDPNRDLNDDSYTGIKDGGEYYDLSNYEYIYTPEDASKDYTSLGVVPNSYITRYSEGLTEGVHYIGIELCYKEDSLYAAGEQADTYEDIENEAIEQDWKYLLEEEDETYDFTYGKGQTGGYEYYYSCAAHGIGDGLYLYTVKVYFDISDAYILEFEESYTGTNTAGLGLFTDGVNIDADGYAAYLATWIVPEN